MIIITGLISNTGHFTTSLRFDFIGTFTFHFYNDITKESFKKRLNANKAYDFCSTNGVVIADSFYVCIHKNYLSILDTIDFTGIVYGGSYPNVEYEK